MSTVDSKLSNQKEQIDLLMDECGYQPGYDEGSEINENDANGEEQGEYQEGEEMIENVEYDQYNEDNNEKKTEINEQDNANQSELSSFDNIEDCKVIRQYFTNNNEKFPGEQQVNYIGEDSGNFDDHNEQYVEEGNEYEQIVDENDYENEDDREMERSSHYEWSKLFNYLNNINEDIHNMMDESTYLEYALQDMEGYTKKLQNQAGEEKDNESERTSEELKDNNANRKYMTFSEVVEGLPSGLEKEKLQNFINSKKIQSYLGKNNNYTSGGYSNNEINLSSGNNSFVVNDAKVLPKVVFPEEEYHHGWQYYDEWKKSNKTNTTLEQAAKNKLKDEINTYYDWLSNEWQSVATYALKYNNLDAMNDVINANFAKVTPL